MKLSTDHRALELQSGRAPENEAEIRYSALLKGEPCTNEAVNYAIEVYEDDYKREVLEAFLLAQATNDDVESVLRVPADVTRAYRQLFWDAGVFKDELDIEAYAQTYGDNDYGKEIKVCAITLGLGYLRYRFSRGQHSEISLLDALQNMIETSYVLCQATRLNPMDSNASKEARQWMSMVVKNIDQYIKTRPVLDDFNDEFEIALKNIDKTTKERIHLNILKEDLLH